jgi:Cu-Zn family superoxide dismutase
MEIRRTTMTRLITALALSLAAGPVLAQSQTDTAEGPVTSQDEMTVSVARGTILDAEGSEIGTVTATDTESGVVHVIVSAEGIEPGGHAIHFHETGECEGDFSSAGGHIAGGRQHGLVEGGPHPGDLPNAHVQEDGILMAEAFDARLDLREAFMDEDGAAFIIHSGADDYESQPSGDAGERVACAVMIPEMG